MPLLPAVPYVSQVEDQTGLQVQQGPYLQVVSTPIWFEPLPSRAGKGCGDKNHRHERAGECG